jgi:hypothetical protein
MRDSKGRFIKGNKAARKYGGFEGKRFCIAFPWCKVIITGRRNRKAHSPLCRKMVSLHSQYKKSLRICEKTA